jgi:hypothetical protein
MKLSSKSDSSSGGSSAARSSRPLAADAIGIRAVSHDAGVGRGSEVV